MNVDVSWKYRIHFLSSHQRCSFSSTDGLNDVIVCESARKRVRTRASTYVSGDITGSGS